MRPRVVAFKLEILVAEGEEVFHIGIDHHAGQGARGARQLQLCLLDMVQVEMCVTRPGCRPQLWAIIIVSRA